MVRFKGKRGIQDARRESRVSIPKWYDLKKVFGSTGQTSHLVSIPKWYDLKVVSYTGLRPFSMFQFQNGTI